MSKDPERFVTFVLGSFIFVYYLGLGFQVLRIWRRIGKSPLVAFTQGSWIEKIQAGGSLCWPLIALTWAYYPGWFRGLPALRYLENWPIRMAGLFLLCLAASVVWISYAELGDSWRIGVDPAATPYFIRTGIYASVRHPVYSALWAWFLGMFLLAPNLLFALLWAVNSTLVVYQAYREEAYLSSKFGKTYQDYMLYTGRFFPLWF